MFSLMCDLIHHPEPSEPFRLDAVTSATGGHGGDMDTIPIWIDSGFVYDTFAILHLYSNDGYNKHYVMYGLGNKNNLTIALDSSEAIDSVIVPNFNFITLSNTHICTLANLQPYTTYRIVYRGEDENKTDENHFVWTSFTTTKLSSHF